MDKTRADQFLNATLSPPVTRALKLAWLYGHQRNPAHSEVPDDLAWADLEKLDSADPEFRGLIQSYQEFFKEDLDWACLKHHRRARANIDGDVGPATVEIIDMPRCGHPDFLREQEANWPDACRRELRSAYAMSHRGLTDEQLRDLWLEMQANWNGALEDVHIELDESDDAMRTAHIYAAAKRLSGNTLAWSFLPQNSCRYRTEQAYNTITWSGRLFLATASHEVGHALGLQHLRDRLALMFPTIHQAAMDRRGFPHASDLAQCRRIGYTVAADPKPEPPDQPEPPDPQPPGPTPPQPDVEIVDGKILLRIGGRDRPFRLIQSGGF